MFNSAILDVAIGLIFVYLLLAMVCTVVNECLAGWRQWRSRELQAAVTALLGDDAGRLFGHALVSGFAAPAEKQTIRGLLGRKQSPGPSYIDPTTFARALLDLVRGPRPAIAEGTTAAKVVSSLEMSANARNEPIETVVAEWFESAMQRVGGRYKRKVQGWTLGIALAVTLIANADTLEIARRLWQNPALRAATVAEAQVRAQKEPPLSVTYPYPDSPEPSDPVVTKPEATDAYTLSEKEKELLGQLMGWEQDWKNLNELQDKRKASNQPFSLPAELAALAARRASGWLLTALAVSLGAPFWFDMLNKVINVRNAGRKPEPLKKGDGK